MKWNTRHIKLVLLTAISLYGYILNGQNQPAFTQDTISLSYSDAEQRLLQKNLTVLLNKYNVDIAKASYLQAKLIYNPNFTYGTTLYNQETKKFLDNKYPAEGETDNTFQLQQLITLAGRHKATWKLAEVGVKQAEYQVADILRNLKYELCTDMSDLYNNQQMIKIYALEEEKVKHLIDITQELYDKGNAAGNDVVRLQAQYQDIIAQELSSRQSINSDEEDLRILLAYKGKTYIVANIIFPESVSIPAYQSVLDSAEKNRPDLLLSYAGCEYAKKNLRLQQVTGVPDLTIGVSNIGAGSVISSYWGLSASMDLPVFNRNQWNVAGAKYSLDQSELDDSLSLFTIQSQVTTAYVTMLQTNSKLHNIPSHYEKDLDEMIADAFTNYEKRYISILDFLSELNTYTDGKNNLFTLKVQYFNAIHNINSSTGIDIIK